MVGDQAQAGIDPPRGFTKGKRRGKTMRGAGGAVSARSIGALAFLSRMLPIVISLPTMTPNVPH